MSPRIGWYRRSAWVETFRPDGLGNILISGGEEPPVDIAFSDICCDVCNGDAGVIQEDGSEGLIFFDGSDSLCPACGARAERRLLAEIVDSIKQKSFVPGYAATDSEAMGLLIAQFFQWDGLAILRASQYALGDANFHAEGAKVSGLADAVEKGAGPETPTARREP